MDKKFFSVMNRLCKVKSYIFPALSDWVQLYGTMYLYNTGYYKWIDIAFMYFFMY